MLAEKVNSLLQDALDERNDLFLIEKNIAPDNSIKIIIDGDKGVTLQDCMFVSRAIEHNIDREEQDFSLEVMSAGATTPLTHTRQYKKNVGRFLEVKTNTEIYEGKLTNADDNEVTLEWKAREPKPIGKGKVTVQKQVKVVYGDIVEAKVVIKF